MIFDTKFYKRRSAVRIHGVIWNSMNLIPTAPESERVQLQLMPDDGLRDRFGSLHINMSRKEALELGQRLVEYGQRQIGAK